MTNPIPHPHADILRAIADGKTIQIKYLNPNQQWKDITHGEFFGILYNGYQNEFRIKPETKTGWINIFTGPDGDFPEEVVHLSKDAALKHTKDGSHEYTSHPYSYLTSIQITYTPGEGL